MVARLVETSVFPSPSEALVTMIVFGWFGRFSVRSCSPQLPELLRHDGARLAICHQLCRRNREKRSLRAVSWISAQRPDRLRLRDLRVREANLFRQSHGYRRTVLRLRLRNLRDRLLSDDFYHSVLRCVPSRLFRALCRVCPFCRLSRRSFRLFSLKTKVYSICSVFGLFRRLEICSV